jgi:iron-sulfur cluster repair protein YtfE (RIC family)
MLWSMQQRYHSSEWLDFHDERRRGLPALVAFEAHCERAEEPDPRWVAALGEQVTALVQALQAHYAAEEEGALYASVPREHPELAPALLRLLAEHDEILDELDALLTRAKDRTLGPEARDRLALHAQRVAARIRRHEAEEEELQLRAVCEELDRGAGSASAAR